MNFSKSYFGKSLHDLTVQDLTGFFSTKREETNRIEFKSFTEHSKAGEDVNNIKKGICALLNSEGGILIWGSPVGKVVPDKKEKVFEGSLSPVSKQYEKDQLINMIADSLTPMPVSVMVQPLEIDGKFVYVFEVQESAYRPHQFGDKYFVRMDGQTKPAPHYLIEALMKQVRYPNLEGYLKVVNVVNVGDQGYNLDLEFSLFNFSRLQNEENLSLQVLVSRGLLYQFSKEESQNTAEGNSQILIHQVTDVLRYGQPALHRLCFTIGRSELYDLDHGTGKSPVELKMIFGGKFSPAKESSYHITFKGGVSDNSQNPYTTQNELSYNSYINVMKENVLLADRDDSDGINKDDLLKNYLGR